MGRNSGIYIAYICVRYSGKIHKLRVVVEVGVVNVRFGEDGEEILANDIFFYLLIFKQHRYIIATIKFTENKKCILGGISNVFTFFNIQTVQKDYEKISLLPLSLATQ